MRDVYNLLRLHATCTPQKPAIILADRFLTHEMIWSGLGSVQAAVVQLRLDHDKPVAILIDDPARHMIVWLALMRSGFTTASIRAEHLDLISAFGFQALFSDQRLPVQSRVKVHFVDAKWFTSQASEFETPFPANRIARIAFTSGSTGRPKAIGITAAVVERRVLDYSIFRLGRGRSPRTLALYGISSVPFEMLRVLASGNSLVFSPMQSALQTMLTLGVEEVFCSASQARALVEMQKDLRFPLRVPLFSMGAGVLSPGLADEIQKTFLCAIRDSYASTEASFAGVAFGELLRLREQRGNCFLPVAQVEVVGDHGEPKRPGEEGRVRIRAEAMAWPFTGSMIETEDVKGDGWFYPGDAGRIDPDGILVVSGRVDEVINSGGVKFAPEVIEEALRRHPKLRDAAMVRMTGAGGEHEIWLAVVTEAPVNLAELNPWVQSQFTGELASVAISKLFVIDEIPLAGAGKVARQQLRQRLLDMSATGN